MRVILLILSLVVSLNVSADETIERWKCYKDKYSSNVLVTATVKKGRTEGEIQVAGVVHEASFKVVGFNRRWNFSLDKVGYRFAFIIKPAGDASYYDFNGVDVVGTKIEPSMFLHCSQKK